jgi:hypothetical protein
MRKKTWLLLFILGLGIGIFFGLSKVKASTPVYEASGGETAASVTYDEVWKATQALVSTISGYSYFYPYGTSPTYPLPVSPTYSQTPVAGMFENTAGGWVAKIFPKMAVTKWKVHGHVHFE